MSSIIDQSNLPKGFPTHRHSPEFWEALGRAIASFGFLENILAKAIFAFTATRQHPPEHIEAAYEAWLKKLEKALTDQLWNLAESYGKAAKEHQSITTSNIDELVGSIKRAAVVRNVLCHASWPPPSPDGFCTPFFVNRKLEMFTSLVDTEYLKQVHLHVSELSCIIIDSVTHMGLQFPGSNGPGDPIL